ncbi:MAG: hypothetical protein GX960_13095 [Actinomycetales bacterium]|nr:hypothetical protein [Actinomycetales bacterium]
MRRIVEWFRRQREALRLAGTALREWRARQVLIAALAALAIALVMGLATVLIPNSFFTRDIPTLPWNYPVWILTSVLMGILIATYVAPPRAPAAEASGSVDASEARSARTGTAAGILAWFAVGCPVCNKIALLALGYSGALTWFAPAQPFLAALALVLSLYAVIWRLKGQVACPVPLWRAPQAPVAVR